MRDKYYISDGIIICKSSSGNTYKIVEGSCTCKGFSFRRVCRHHTYCLQNKLFESLKKNRIEKQVLSSNAIIKLRKDSLRKFLDGIKIPYTEEIINEVEPKIKTTTDPEKLVKVVNKLYDKYINN